MAGIMPRSEEVKLRGYLKTLGEHYMIRAVFKGGGGYGFKPPPPKFWEKNF
jgi:hypothetical protein